MWTDPVSKLPGYSEIWCQAGRQVGAVNCSNIVDLFVVLLAGAPVRSKGLCETERQNHPAGSNEKTIQNHAIGCVRTQSEDCPDIAEAGAGQVRLDAGLD
jgi:hypothetical protein